MYVGLFWGVYDAAPAHQPTDGRHIHKIISEQNCIGLFKIGHRKHWLELPKVDRGREQMFPLSV